MGKKARKERIEKREDFAVKRSREKRKNALIAAGVLGLIAVIVGYSAYTFINQSGPIPGSPPGAGALGDEHEHASVLVRIFGDKFDFSGPAFQIKSSWIHFEGRDGSTIHKHATGVTLEFLFDSLLLGLDDKCFVFQDGRSFCTNEDYSLKLFINEEQVSDIRDYEVMEGDRVLILYGGQTPEEIESIVLKLENQELVK